jgi:hypothetical protein
VATGLTRHLNRRALVTPVWPIYADSPPDVGYLNTIAEKRTLGGPAHRDARGKRGPVRRLGMHVRYLVTDHATESWLGYDKR